MSGVINSDLNYLDVSGFGLSSTGSPSKGGSLFDLKQEIKPISPSSTSNDSIGTLKNELSGNVCCDVISGKNNYGLDTFKAVTSKLTNIAAEWDFGSSDASNCYVAPQIQSCNSISGNVQNNSKLSTTDIAVIAGAGALVLGIIIVAIIV